jgi:hypothetical protein
VARDARNIAQATGEGRLVSLREAGNYYPPGPGSFADSTAYSARWLIPNTNAVWGARSANGYLSNTVDGFQNIKRYLAQGVGNERLLDAAGVKVLVLPRQPPYPKYMTQQTVKGAAVVRNAGAMPQGWRADTVREFPDRPAAVMALMDPEAFLERSVYTEKAADGKAARLRAPDRKLAGAGNPPFSFSDKLAARIHRFLGSNSTVASNRSTPCRQDFEVNYVRSGFLVFNETFAPGWRAWVDGNPRAILRAYGLFMAVTVRDPGLRRITFRYEPASFRLGLFLSLASFAALLAAGLSRKRFVGKR